MIQPFFSIIFSFAFLGAVAQQRSFEVVLLGSVIGETNIVKKDEGKGNFTYQLKSTSSAKILFQERNSDMNFDVRFVGGRLQYSLCKVTNNGKLATTEIVKDAGGYTVSKEDEILRVTEPITFSSMELYFSEPVNQKKVFSERMGEFAYFTKTAPGEYTNKIKDVTNVYRYRNGALYEVEIRKPLGSVYLRAKK